MIRRVQSLLAACALAMTLAATTVSPGIALAATGPAPVAEQSQPETAQSPAGQAAGEPSLDDMPVTDMAWPTDMSDGMMMQHPDKPKALEGRLLAWFGMWHPAVIHFPIALVLTVALLELAAVIRRKPTYAASSRLLLGIATVGAFVAAPLGWANAGMPAPGDSLALDIHRWLGSALPFVILALWALKRPVDQAAVRLSSRSYELVLAATVALLLVQAYFGAEITHGANHMAF